MTTENKQVVRRTALPLTALIVLAAGCTEPDTSPLPNTLPTTTVAPSSDRPLPPATGTWTRLAEKCPQLTNQAASGLGVGGQGRPTPDYRSTATIITADCQWGSTDGTGASVTARLVIYPAQPAADAAWQALTAGRTQPTTGVGDEAFVTIEPPAVAVRARSNNAVATIRLLSPSATTANELGELEPAAVTITRDVLDDLR
ncbi:hypothetical protein ACSNN7_01090 [Micromonospora sp. URMC 105]|uniref:hypothetical protein n=1 Tax=Micromonospora sp. URMC 105 TaxID=3423413 RepID=UPI003F1DCDD7